MDAQNAAESDQTRPAASSHHRRSSVVDKKPKSPKSPTTAKAASPNRDAKSKTVAPGTDDASSATARPDEATEDRDSDAETIVLPGKDGHSPSKARKVRQEDKSESDGDAAKRSGAGKDDAEKSNTASSATGAKPTDGARRKRLSVSAGSSADKDRRARTKDGASSGLSSAPTSPPHKDAKQNAPARRRRSDAAASSPSDSEQSQHKSSKTSLRDKLKSGERLLSQKRKAPKIESDDEGDFRKARRQRTTSAGIDSGRLPRDPSTKSSSQAKPDTRNRSTSPPLRQHRRSTSTQLPSQSSNGLSVKKRRLPPPLQSTEYQSDDSSTGGSPRPRSSKLRSLTTPAATDSNISPAKIVPHKKHLDAHGQTLLARACARGEYDGAKQRLGERPEDLNVADYAGNTPLQIAAINGCEDIVKLLIDAGCNLDCVNYDKDTPLLDAVDNGHLGVVKLLLGAGVNPRKANVNGEEPIDRVSDETDNADEIRAALTDAKKKAGERRRTSEDHHSHTDHHDARDDSPRHSPAATSAGGRRGGTVRSTKTRNDLLYMPLDDKTLRQAAGRGDEETVARILQVKEGYDDPESMVAAARGGHDLVIQLLLGLGGANADPGPVTSLPGEFATPILAAIGQENIKVVELLLEQQGFDPTRRFKGETYYEIARRRQGTNWKEEEHLLRNSYDEYKRSHKDTLKTKSPGTRRERERLREERAATKRDDNKDDSRQSRRPLASPSRESDLKKRTSSSSKLDSPRDRRRNSTTTRGGEDDGQKRGPGRPKKEPSNNSDREASPALSHKAHKAKRAESDATGMSSDGETSKPRRKLISKGELRGERDKQKRTPSHKQPSSPREGRTGEDGPEKSNLSEKYHDRAKALKRDESRDRPTGDGATKRHRTSVTPDRPGDVEKDSSEVPVKRRRLEGDAAENRQKRVSSEDGRQRKSTSSRDGSAKPKDDSGKDSENKSSATGEKSILVKSEDVDVPMPDLEPTKDTKPEEASKPSHGDGAKSKKELTEEEAKKAEERKVAEAEAEKKRKEEEESKKKREEEAAAAAAAAAEAKKRAEQEERERLEAAEAARKAEEERLRVEEEERKKKEKEEEERRKREEEERLRQEQLEREAAEEAKRQREEEERKERERRERAHREEMERKRAAREAEQRRIREEQERARLEKLPPLLRWLDTHPGPKAAAVTDKFKHMLGVRYDTIRPEATGTVEGREQWVLNTHVALLLGEKDLDLSRYTAWERAPVSLLAKTTIWRTEWPRYTLLSEKLWELGRQLPGYFGESDPSTLDFQTKQQLKLAAWEKFLALDMFFVKLSDFLYTVPNIPHLRNIRLAVEYRELLENESQLIGWRATQKWKQDPGAERFHGFAPRSKYYINGAMVGEDMPTCHQTSKTPFPEKRVPRRGLVQVLPDDPEYERFCVEQGLEHLLKGRQTPTMPNGLYSSPTLQSMPTPTKPIINGTNGHANGTAVNGIHGSG